MSLGSLIRSFHCICPLAKQISMDLPHVVHCGRPNQHHTDAGLAPHRDFTISERMFDGTHGCFHGGSIVVRTCAGSSAPLSPHRAVQILLRETEYALGTLLQWLCRTLIDKRARLTHCGIEASQVAMGFPAPFNVDTLLVGTLNRSGMRILIELPVKVVQPSLPRLSPADGCLNLGDTLVVHHCVDIGTVVPAIGVHLVNIGPFLEFGQHLSQHRSIIGVV